MLGENQSHEPSQHCTITIYYLKRSYLAKLIDFNNLPVCLLQSLQLLFLDKRDGSANKNEKLYKPIIRKV